MKIDDVRSLVKHKVLLAGASGTGKSHIALQTSFLFSSKGKKVSYIDPEFGTQKELSKLYNSGEISDKEIGNIDMVTPTSWDKFRDAIVSADGDLVVVDCISEAMRLFGDYLKNKFISQGYYVIGGKEVRIKDKDTFTVPWELTSRVYDKLLEVMYYLIREKKHVLITVHPIGGTTAREELQNSLMAKVDTVIELSAETSNGNLEFYGYVRKNRGGTAGVRIKNPGDAVVKMFEEVI